MGSLSRSQKRKQLLKSRKKNNKPENTSATTAKEQPDMIKYINQIPLLIKEIDRLNKNVSTLDRHLWMVVETLADKDILNWSDVNKTQDRYTLREQKRKQKIQELLESDNTVEEILEEIVEDPNLKNYDKLNINPIKELNLNPNEVAEHLLEKHPDFTKEQYMQLGSKWGLTDKHFGFDKEVDAAPMEYVNTTSTEVNP